MATDPYLLERIRRVLKNRNITWNEKKMFGGDCFMVDEKMCFGTYQGGMMLRVGPEAIPALEKRTGADQMIHGGRPMTGYIFLQPEGFDREDDLEFWIDQCLAHNPFAKASKKKKKKQADSNSI